MRPRLLEINADEGRLSSILSGTSLPQADFYRLNGPAQAGENCSSACHVEKTHISKDNEGQSKTEEVMGETQQITVSPNELSMQRPSQSQTTSGQGSHYLNMTSNHDSGIAQMGLGRLELIATRGAKTVFTSQTVLKQGVHYIEIFHPIGMKQIEIGLIKETNSSSKQEIFTSLKNQAKAVIVQIDFEKNRMHIIEKKSKARKEVSFKKGRYWFAVRLWGIGNCVSINPFHLTQSNSIANFDNSNYLDKSFENVFKIWKLLDFFDLGKLVEDTERKEREEKEKEEREEKERKKREEKERKKREEQQQREKEEGGKAAATTKENEIQKEEKSDSKVEETQTKEEQNVEPKETEIKIPKTKKTAAPVKEEKPTPVSKEEQEKIDAEKLKKEKQEEEEKKKNEEEAKKQKEEQTKKEELAKQERLRAEEKKKEEQKQELLVQKKKLEEKIQSYLDDKSKMLELLNQTFRVTMSSFLKVEDFVYDHERKILSIKCERVNYKILRELNSDFSFFSNRRTLCQILKKILLCSAGNCSSLESKNTVDLEKLKKLIGNKVDQKLAEFLRLNFGAMIQRFPGVEELRTKFEAARSKVCELMSRCENNPMHKVESAPATRLQEEGTRLEAYEVGQSGNILVMDKTRAMKVVPRGSEGLNPFALGDLTAHHIKFDMGVKELSILFESINWQHMFEHFMLDNEQSEHLSEFFTLIFDEQHHFVNFSKIFFCLPEKTLNSLIYIVSEYMKQSQWLVDASLQKRGSVNPRKMTEFNPLDVEKVEALPVIVEAKVDEKTIEKGAEKAGDAVSKKKESEGKEGDLGLNTLYGDEETVKSPRPQISTTGKDWPTSKGMNPQFFDILLPSNINGKKVPSASDLVQSILIRIEEAIYMQRNFRADNTVSVSDHTMKGTDSAKVLKNAELSNISRPHSAFHRLFSYLTSVTSASDLRRMVDLGYFSFSGFRTEHSHFLGSEIPVRGEDLGDDLQTGEEMIERNNGLNRQLARLPNENISLSRGIELLPGTRLTQPLKCFNTDNSQGLLVTLDKSNNLAIWGTKFGLTNLVTTALDVPLIPREINKVVRYAMEKDKVNDTEFFGLNGENKKISISQRQLKKKEKPKMKIPKLPIKKGGAASMQTITNNQQAAKLADLKESLTNQLFSMGFNFAQINPIMEECSVSELNVDIIISKILEAKDSQTQKKKGKPASKMILKPEWSCKICTFYNVTMDVPEANAEECQMCFTPADEDAFLTEVFIEEVQKQEEIAFANMVNKTGFSMSEHPSNLSISLDPVECLLRPSDEVEFINIVEFKKENLLNRFIVAIVIVRDSQKKCLLVRLGYTQNFVNSTLFLNKYENKVSSFLAHGYVPKGEEERELGDLFANKFSEQLHHIYPFIRQSEMLEQTGRLVFDFKGEPSDFKLRGMGYNKTEKIAGPLKQQDIIGSLDESQPILNYFTSDNDTVALLAREGDTLFVYNIVNQAQEFYKNDIQVDLSSKLKFQSEIQWVRSKDERILFQTGTEVCHLDLDYSCIKKVLATDPGQEQRVLSVQGQQRLSLTAERKLVLKSRATQILAEKRIDTGDCEEAVGCQILEQFKHPSEMLQTLKNTSSVSFLPQRSKNFISFSAPSHPVSSFYWHLINPQAPGSVEFELSSSQKALVLETEIFARIEKSNPLWPKIKSHLNDSYSKLESPEFKVHDPKLKNSKSATEKLELSSIEALGGKNSTKHFVSQIFQDDKESFLSKHFNSLLVFESVFSKRMRVNQLLIECPKMWDDGNALETAMVVFFEDLSSVNMLSQFSSLPDNQIQPLLSSLSLQYILVKIEAGRENIFFFEKEFQGRYCALVPLKYKSLSRGTSSKLVMSKFFVYGNLTNSAAFQRTKSESLETCYKLSLKDDFPLEISVRNESQNHVKQSLVDSQTKQFWVEGYEEDDKHAGLICRFQTEIEAGLVGAVKIEYVQRQDMDLHVVGVRPKIYSEKNFSILEFKNKLKNEEFSILDEALSRFKTDMTKPEIILDSLQLLKFLIQQYSSKIINVILSHLDLKDFMVRHLIQDFSVQRLHSVSSFLLTLLTPETEATFKSVVFDLLGGLEDQNPSKNGLESFANFIKLGFLSAKAATQESKNEIISKLLDFILRCVKNISKLENSNIRTLRYLKMECLFQPLVDFATVGVLTSKATVSNGPNPQNQKAALKKPETPKKETKIDLKNSLEAIPKSKDSVSKLMKQLRFQTNLSRNDKLLKGTMISRKFDNHQEFVFLSEKRAQLTHLWGRMEYVGPACCFSVLVEVYCPGTRKFKFLKSKLYNEDFMHSVVVSKGKSFGLNIPFSSCNLDSRLFRIKINFNYIPSISYIEGLDVANFDFEFGTSEVLTQKMSTEMGEIPETKLVEDFTETFFETEFSSIDGLFDESIERNRAFEKQISEKEGESGDSDAEPASDSGANVEGKEELTENEESQKLEENEENRLSKSGARFQELLAICGTANEKLSQLELKEDKRSALITELKDLAKQYETKTAEIGESNAFINPAMSKTPENLNFWLQCLFQFDKMISENSKTNEALIEKGESFLIELFEGLVRDVYVPEHLASSKLFSNIILAVPEETRANSIHQSIENLVEKSNQICFVQNIKTWVETLVEITKCHKSVPWQSLMDHMAEKFLYGAMLERNDPGSEMIEKKGLMEDRNIQFLMAYNCCLDKVLPTLWEEKEIDNALVIRTLQFCNFFLAKNLFNINEETKKNVIQLTRNALKSLNEDSIQTIDGEVLSSTIKLFIKNDLFSTLEEIFIQMCSKFVSKKKKRCIVYLDELLQTMLKNEFSNSSELIPGTLCLKKVNLLEFLLKSLVMFEKNLYPYAIGKKSESKEKNTSVVKNVKTKTSESAQKKTSEGGSLTDMVSSSNNLRKSLFKQRRESLRESLTCFASKGPIEERLDLMLSISRRMHSSLFNKHPNLLSLVTVFITNLSVKSQDPGYDRKALSLIENKPDNQQEIISRVYMEQYKQAFTKISCKKTFNKLCRRACDIITHAMAGIGGDSQAASSFAISADSQFILKIAVDMSDYLVESKNKKGKGGDLSVSLQSDHGWKLLRESLRILFQKFHLGTGESFRELNGGLLEEFRLIKNCLQLISETTDSTGRFLMLTVTDNFKSNSEAEALWKELILNQISEWLLVNNCLKSQPFKNPSGTTYQLILNYLKKIYHYLLSKKEIGKILLKVLIEHVEKLYNSLLKKDRDGKTSLAVCYYLDNAKALISQHLELLKGDVDLARDFLFERNGLRKVLKILKKSQENEQMNTKLKTGSTSSSGLLGKILKSKQEDSKEKSKKGKDKVVWDKDMAIIEEEFGKKIQFRQVDFNITNGSNIQDWVNNKNGRSSQIYTASFPHRRKEIRLVFKMKNSVDLRLFRIGFNVCKLDQQYPVGAPSFVHLFLNFKDSNGNPRKVDIGLLDYVQDGGYMNFNTRVYYFNPLRFRFGGDLEQRLGSLEHCAGFCEFELVIGRPQQNYYDLNSPYLVKRSFIMNQVMINFISLIGCDQTKIHFKSHFASSIKSTLYLFLGQLFNSDSLGTLLSDYLDSEVSKSDGVFPLVASMMDLFIKDFSLDLSKFILSVASKEVEMSKLIFSFLLKDLPQKPEFYGLLETMMQSGLQDYEFLFKFWDFGSKQLKDNAKFGPKFLEVLSNTLLYHLQSGQKVFFPLNKEFFEVLRTKYSKLRFEYSIERAFALGLHLLNSRQVVTEFDRETVLDVYEARDSSPEALEALETSQTETTLQTLQTEIIVGLVDDVLLEKDLNALMLLGYAAQNIEEAKNSIQSFDIFGKLENLMDSNQNLAECLVFLKYSLNIKSLRKILLERELHLKLFSYLQEAFDPRDEKDENNKPDPDWRKIFEDKTVLRLLLTVIFGIFRSSSELVQDLEAKLFDLLKKNKTNSFFVEHVLLELFDFQLQRPVVFEYDPEDAKMQELANQDKELKASKAEKKGLRALPVESMSQTRIETLENTLKQLVDPDLEKLIMTQPWERVVQSTFDSEDLTEPIMNKLFAPNPMLIFIRMANNPQNNYLGIFAPGGFQVEKTGDKRRGYVPNSDNCFMFMYCSSGKEIVAHYSRAQFSKIEKFLLFENIEESKTITMEIDSSEKIVICMDNEGQSLLDLYPMKCLHSDPDPNLEFPCEESISHIEIFQMKMPTSKSNLANPHYFSSMTVAQKKLNSVDWLSSVLSSEFVFNIQQELTIKNICSVLNISIPKKINNVEITKENESTLKLRDLPGDQVIFPSSKKINFVENKNFTDQYNPVYPVFDVFCDRGGIRFVLQTIIKNEAIPFLKKKDDTTTVLKENLKGLLEFESIQGFSGSLIQNKEFLPAVFELFIAGSTSKRKWEDWNMFLSALIFGRLAILLKNSPTSEKRTEFVEKKVHKKLLSKLAELTNDISRKFISDEELARKNKETEEETIRETKDPENFKKEIKKRKGVGYDKEGSGKKWVIADYLEKKKKRNNIIIELLRLFNNLFVKEDAINALDSDPKAVDRKSGLFRTIAESCILSMLESAFKCSSLHEMAKDFELYREYCNVVLNISSHPDLKPLMYKLPINYQPYQIQSLISVLKKQEKNTNLFKRIADEQDNQKGQTTTKDQNESDAHKSMEFAKFISKTIEEVKGHFGDFEDSSEEDERIRVLLSNFDTLSVNDQYKLAVKNKQYGMCDMMKSGTQKFDHHYAEIISSEAKTMQGSQVVRLAQEIADLTASLPTDSYNPIFVRADQNRLDVIKAMIAGAESTPYANGLFEYHLYLPSGYPKGPPKCNLETTGSGDVRFNPNLYACGKVCLSLLGTWRGNASENWDPKISNLLQVLLSIQAVVMSEEVYFNEPGYEGESGTVEGEKKNEGYSNIVRLCNIKYGMIRHMKNPVKGFEEATRIHFYLKRRVIMREVGTWIKMAEQRDAGYNGLVMDHNSKYCTRFQAKKDLYLKELKEQIVLLEAGLKELEVTFDITSVFKKSSKLNSNAKQKEKEEREREEKRKEKERKEKLRKEQQKNLQMMMQKIDVKYDDAPGASNTANKREFNAEDKTVADRWSRYIGAMGIEAVKKQSQANVLLLGSNSLGVEVAKNLTLGGVNQLVLADWDNVDKCDQIGNFFARGEEGNNRAESVVRKLRQLNFYVKVQARDLSSWKVTKEVQATTETATEDQEEKGEQKETTQIETTDQTPTPEELLKDVHVLIVCQHYAPVTDRLIDLAIKLKIKIVSAEKVGVYSRVFVDLGSQFTVNDKDGEEAMDLFVETIEGDDTVVLVQGSKHNLMDGDYFMIKEVVEEQGDSDSSQAKETESETQETESKETGPKETEPKETAPKETEQKDSKTPESEEKSSEAKEKTVSEPEELKSINKTLLRIESMETNLRIKVESLKGKFKKYVRGGKIKQMKIPFKLDFQSISTLKENEGNPDKMPWDDNLMIHDFEKMGSSRLVSQCFHIKDRIERNLKVPFQSLSFRQISERLTDKENQDEDLITKLRMFSANSFGELPSISAFLGGMISQEAVKAITNKFTPIRQLFCTDFEELLDERYTDPEKINEILKEDAVRSLEEADDKYARLRHLLGQDTLDKVKQAKLFMIGSGAIGCELLKNYAMIGLGSGATGRIILTDPDNIELSNLNRQFLFREKHIGMPKSLVAAKVIETMNDDYQTDHIEEKEDVKVEETPESKGEKTASDPTETQGGKKIEGKGEIEKPKSTSSVPKDSDSPKQEIVFSKASGSKILARLDKICPETEDIYNDEFFESLSLCTNALDNIKARVYMDQRCVKTSRPLLESGTLGPKGHVQVILPHITENYGQVQDANEEGSIPICTLKMFPEETIHCVEWAKDRFDYLFSQRVKSLSRVLEAFIQNKTIQNSEIEVKVIKEAYKMFKKRPSSLEECVQISRNEFQKYYHNAIRQLMYVYPLDFMTKDNKPFWSLPKRPPTHLEFDLENQTHRTFIISYARLLGRVWGFEDSELVEMEPAAIAKILEGFEIKPFVPNDKKAEMMKKENEKEEKEKKEEEKEEKEEEKEEEETKPEQEQETVTVEENQKLIQDFEAKLKKLENIQEIHEKMAPEIFEKDEDSNGHIDFMHSCGNLRALNYKLDQMDWIKVKLKAGRIVPALATTTAAVAGLQTIEAIKTLKQIDIEGHRNCFLNLAINIISLSEPGPVLKHKIHEDLTVTVWDKWEFEFNEQSQSKKTLNGLFEHVKETYKLQIKDILKGNKPVFMGALHKIEEYGSRNLSQLLEINPGEECEVNMVCSLLEKDDLVENIPRLVVRHTQV